MLAESAPGCVPSALGGGYLSKLPQARLYLNSAQWGIDELVKGKLTDYPFRFHMIGILAALRAVQHALLNHDRKISPTHRMVIDEWWKRTTPQNAAELAFIKTARDLILKEGAFESYATRTESGIGEGKNYTVTDETYELAYYVGEVRHDLLVDLRGAAAWCERELTSIEAKLPEPEE
jgi:hypothetical protein